jgi:hypothetical protein
MTVDTTEVPTPVSPKTHDKQLRAVDALPNGIERINCPIQWKTR